jgi:acetyltransferase-like isoleucine patch superfamily enzyme
MGMFAKAALASYRAGTDARNKAFALACGGAFGAFGKRSVLQLPIRLDGESRIHVGERVFVGASSWLQVIGDDPDARLTIGDGTALSGHTVLAAARSLTIGRRVLMARGVYVADHGHAFADLERPVIEQGLAGIAPVEICDGAWLGENVVICPGVRVGRNAVIGANAVVTRDVPDNCVAVGVPARVIREAAASDRVKAGAL